MHRRIARLIFYPTLAWNLLWTRVFGVWKWWSRVDDHVVLGALPFPSLVQELHQQGVRAIVNTCEEYAGPVREYEQFGMSQLRVPTVDFTPPTLESVDQAVNFMAERIEQGETVYVHCKAGRGRSATIVLCWLIQTKGLSPHEAQIYIQTKRPQIVKRLYQRQVVQEFAQRHGQPVPDKEGRS